MSSLRLAILSEVHTRLGATGKPTGLVVDLMRLPDIEASEFPHLNIASFEEKVDPILTERRSPLATRVGTLTLEGRALKTDSQSVLAAIDAILVWVTQQLMRKTEGGRTMADHTLGGRALKVFEIGTNITGDETGLASVLATRTYLVEYKTKTESEES